MKKTFLLALFALAIPASAGSIDWKLNTGTGYMVDSNNEKLNGFAYLMLTDTLTDATFSSQDDIKALSVGGAGIEIANGVNKTTTTSTDSRLTVDGVTAYSFTVLVFDPSNNSFYKSSSALEQTAYNTSGDEFTDAKQISFTGSQMYANASTRGTQNWVSVPEPSTAALALAGLALLLKRRRA